MADIREKEQQQNTDFEKNYIDENIKADQDSKAKAFIKKFMKRKTAVLGLIVIVVLVIIAIIGPYITPYDYTAYDYMNTLAGPSPEHLFGTDQYGRDILSRMLVGTRLTLGVSLSGPGIINVLIAVMVFTIPSFARIMRSATLAVKGSLYVEVAQSLGCKDSRLLFVHIFPGTIQSLIVNFTMRIGSAIMAAASLSFLGFGANVSEPEWGAMLSQGRNYIGIASHMVYFPGLIIFITVLAFNLFGDGLRDTLDPKIK